MEYALEKLGDHRFQAMCQALLLSEFPHLQCFPLGQADGGRDGVSKELRHTGNRHTVMQVKYSRRPDRIRNPATWLIGTLKEELPKIEKLISQGMDHYVVVTNVPGTGMANAGSIDKLDEFLSKKIEVPSICYWRDDVCRRIDANLHIRWSYPELLSGTDLISVLTQAGGSAKGEEIAMSLRAYLRDQYVRDRDVRFKQIELQQDLFSLFVDCPLKPKNVEENASGGQATYAYKIVARCELDVRKTTTMSSSRYLNVLSLNEGSVGGAHFLLHPNTQDCGIDFVVEGSPGQGKSTLVQFVAQYHRARLLGECVVIHDENLRNLAAPVRFPIKCELRDFASWLNGGNPFGSPGVSPRGRSLESFLAHLIDHFSGETGFLVADLQALLESSRVLLILDGLDEVAEAKERADVVGQILEALPRMRQICQSLQTVITSRPAAFVNSPGFPEKEFFYLVLGRLEREHIESYAMKWLTARRIEERTSAEVMRILRSRLEEPHLAELSTNPMQLAILLSLIHTRGASLPDKRTSLYDNYMELFFNRESEKSKVVRDNRDLLVSLHSFIAWHLHAATQTGNHRGAISSDDLKRLVNQYLDAEGYGSALLDNLFTGMVERVVALVSRVEGTYEFEVQPLREYFAARHLYNTAPYSPVGTTLPGTLPERFTTIAADPYWLNTTRFFAGCYSMGELASLLEGLRELKEDSRFKYSGSIEALALMLLSDRVFSLQPRIERDVALFAVEGDSLSRVLSNSVFQRQGETSYPNSEVKSIIRERCLEAIPGTTDEEMQTMIGNHIRTFTSDDELLRIWRKQEDILSPAELLRLGQAFRVLNSISREELESTLGTDEDNTLILVELPTLLQAGRLDVLESTSSRANVVVEHVLKTGNSMYWRSLTSYLPEELSRVLKQSGIAKFLYSVDCVRYWSIGRRRIMERSISLAEADNWIFRHYRIEGENSPVCPQTPQITDGIEYLFSEATKQFRKSINDWDSSIEPWSILVETGRKHFGESILWRNIAVIAAAKLRKDKNASPGDSNLLNPLNRLCSRMQAARRRAGNLSWWKKQFRSARDKDDILLVLHACANLTGPKTLLKIIDEISGALESLSVSDWGVLSNGIEMCLTGLRDGRNIEMGELLDNQGAHGRATVLLGFRASEEDMIARWREISDMVDLSEVPALRFIANLAIGALYREGMWGNDALNVIQEAARCGIIPSRSLMRLDLANAIPLSRDALNDIAALHESLPCMFNATIRDFLVSRIGEELPPVAETARLRGWFARDEV